MNRIPAQEYRTKNYIFEMKDTSDIEKHLNDNGYEIGHICDFDYKELLKIIYFKSSFKSFGGHCRLLNTSYGPMIAVSDFFYDNYIKDGNISIICALFMHEFGHYMNGDLDKDVINSDIVRYREIMKNKVMPEELAADRFAVSELKKSVMVNAINKMISVRKKRNDDGLNIAIKEFELRIKAISKI